MAAFLRNTPSLRLDNILSVHPELGPSIPDGGYGWVILVAITFFEAIIPNLLLGFGMCLMFSRLEKTDSVTVAQNLILDDILIYAPIFFMMARCSTEPVCRILIKNSIWPRLIGTCGTCLTSAGIFLIWMERIEHIYKSFTLICGGILSGIGFSLIMCQCEVIITQYFKLKLARINLIRQLTNAIGFIATPILLGNLMIKHGVTHTMLWYAVIILQGIIASIFFKKPNYYNEQPKIYNLVERTNSLEDEYNIFDKNQQIGENVDKTDEMNYQIIPTNMEAQEGGSTSVQIHENITKANNKREDWETFDDDEITVVEQAQHNFKINIPQDRAVPKSSTDTDRIDLDENRVHTVLEQKDIPPSPIFQQENNNSMYSFDDDLGLRQNSRSVYSQNSILKNNANSTYGFLLYPTFYKSLLQLITTRFSTFAFMVLFPSHIFEQTDQLHASSAVYLVGYVGIASLLYIILKVRKSGLNSGERAVVLWFSCWIGCVGFLFVMAIKHETVMLLGGILIVISLNILTYIGEPLLLISPKGETNKIHASLSILCGWAFLIFLCFNITFRTWFLIMAFMLFSTGCVWFGNFYYKKTVALY